MADKSAVGRYWRRGIFGLVAGTAATAVFGIAVAVFGSLAKVSHERDAYEEKAYENVMKNGLAACEKKISSRKGVKKDTPVYEREVRKCFNNFKDGEPDKKEKSNLYKYFMAVMVALSAAGIAFGVRAFLKGIAFTHLAYRKGRPTRRLSAVRVRNTQKLDDKLQRAGVVLKNSPNALAEISLASGATVAAEPGTLAAMDGNIDMHMRLLDKGSVSNIFGRLLTGESLSAVRYCNTGTDPAQLTLRPKNARGVMAVPLEAGEGFYCVEDSYFGAIGNVSVNFERMKSPSLSRFAGLFAMQRLTAAGDDASIALISAKGTVQDKQLAEGETLRLPKGRLVAAAGDVSLDLWEQPTSVGRLFSGSGPFLTTVTGPGRVWYQVPNNVSSLGVIGGLAKRVVDILVPG